MDLSSIDSFMAIGAHCDDVDIRCGGTFARLVAEGKKGCYCVTTENAYTGEHWRAEGSHDALATRRKEVGRASRIIGADRVEWLGLKSHYFSTEEPDSMVFPWFDNYENVCRQFKHFILEGGPPALNADRFPESSGRLRDLIEDFGPQVIFTHSPDDRHPDHYSVARFVEIVVKKMNDDGQEIELYFWEPGSFGPMADFAPDFFVELSSSHVAAKQKAMDCYESQFRKGCLDGFASARTSAYGGIVGVKHAEAFRHSCCPRFGAFKGKTGFIERLERGDSEREIYRL